MRASSVDEAEKLGKELGKLVEKPMKNWSRVETDSFCRLINELNGLGKVVILPFNCCLYCGTPLSDKVTSLGHFGKSSIGLVMPLCEQCSLAASLADHQSQN